MDEWEIAFIEKSVRRRKRGRRRKLIRRAILLVVLTSVIGLGFWALEVLPATLPTR